MSNILRNPSDPPAVLKHLADNLKRLRQAAGLSQDALAVAAEVSRRMLVSIEAGDSNVSLATLDRIAHALGVVFADLVLEHRPDPGPSLAWRSERGSQGLLLQAVPARQQVELWEWTLLPGDSYAPDPDPAGWREIVYVLSGTLTLEVAGETRAVAAGASVAYLSDRPYAYRNQTGETVVFVRNVAV